MIGPLAFFGETPVEQAAAGSAIGDDPPVAARVGVVDGGLQGVQHFEGDVGFLTGVGVRARARERACGGGEEDPPGGGEFDVGGGEGHRAAPGLVLWPGIWPCSRASASWCIRTKKSLILSLQDCAMPPLQKRFTLLMPMR